jgi:hypothetical protein
MKLPLLVLFGSLAALATAPAVGAISPLGVYMCTETLTANQGASRTTQSESTSLRIASRTSTTFAGGHARVNFSKPISLTAVSQRIAGRITIVPSEIHFTGTVTGAFTGTLVRRTIGGAGEGSSVHYVITGAASGTVTIGSQAGTRWMVRISGVK